MLRSGWSEVGGTIECGLDLIVVHRPGLPVLNVPSSNAEDVVSEGGAGVGACTAADKHDDQKWGSGASLCIRYAMGVTEGVKY